MILLPQGQFLSGKVALVTGSAKRLGRTIAVGLAQLGARVAVHYRASQTEALELVAQLADQGTEASAFQADLIDPLACQVLVNEVVRHFGALHILVNNVGDYHACDVLEETPEDWHTVMNSNLHTTFNMCHFGLPHIRKQTYGRIINIGFATSETAGASVNGTAYTIAKHGALVLTRSLAVALKGEPVTVNMVSPGTLEGSIATPWLGEVPKGRWGREDEVASAIAYLLSPQADYVTGQNLQVAGGWGL